MPLMRLFLAAAKTLINFVNKVKIKICSCKSILTHMPFTTFLYFWYFYIKDTTNRKKFNPSFRLIIHYHPPISFTSSFLYFKFLYQS